MFSLICALLLGVASSYTTTPLDDYVWAADAAYGWTVIENGYYEGKNFQGKGWKGYTLNMTSQNWLTPADFSPNQGGSLWWHYVFVIVPDNLEFTNNATLWITGGNQGDSPPNPSSSEDLKVCISLALHTGTIVGALFQIPNEHVTFSSDPTQASRTEDAIIAYTWDHFLNDPSDPTWLVRFPMVKASVRAMDCVTEFVTSNLPELNTKLDYYTVSGASKRGWTTWLVGAVDPTRVMAIIPIVLDAINFVTVEHHQYKSYNGWSWALSDYTNMNIMSRLDDPNMLLLSQMEDPYYYITRLTMPKLIINAMLDEFQQPDDTNYWWNDMPEPKHFIMTPNAEHSEDTGILEIVPAASQWIRDTLEKTTIPKFTWVIDDSTGDVTVTLDEHGIVEEAVMQYGYSCSKPDENGIYRRDFRVATIDQPCTCGISAEGYCGNLKSIEKRVTLNATMVKGHRTYHAHVDQATDGRWVASFIDIKYRQRHGLIDKSIELARDKLVDISKIPHVEWIQLITKPDVKDGDLAKYNGGLFPKDLMYNLEFTSQVSVFPQTFPYADCYMETCAGTLV